MSAAPLPTPDEPGAEAASDADGWALLEALRRRLDDQAAQGRKTQQQVGQLAESIGALVAEQRRRSRWLNMNSFIAYVIFTLLVGVAFFVLYQSRANELVSARDSAEHARELAVQRADEATTKATARDQADARAWEIYELLEAGKRAEAATKLATLGSLPVSRTERAVLAARAHETQVMEVDAALKTAAAAFKAGRYAEVVKPLEAALVGEPAGARGASMRYYLGVAYAKANELGKAIPHLQAAVHGDAPQLDARFQLASALDRSGQYALARGEYDRFATAHPQSHLAVFAMRRSGTLARMPATARKGPRPGPAAALASKRPAPAAPLAPKRPSAAAATAAPSPGPAAPVPGPAAAASPGPSPGAGSAAPTPVPAEVPPARPADAP